MRSCKKNSAGCRFRVGFCSATGGSKAWWLRFRDRTMENQVEKQLETGMIHGFRD